MKKEERNWRNLTGLILCIAELVLTTGAVIAFSLLSIGALGIAF